MVAVGALVGAVVGVLEVEPVLVLLPQALMIVTRTRPMTPRKKRFGNSIMRLLPIKNCCRLVSIAPGISTMWCFPPTDTTTELNSHTMVLTSLQAIRWEVTQTRKMAHE